METRKYIKLIIVLLSQNFAFSQTGGQHIFQFLELSPSARITATGGNGIGWQNAEASTAWRHPGLLNEKMHTSLSANHQNYFDGIKSGHFAYSHYVRKFCLMTQFGVHYYQTGDVIRTDIYGENRGTFYGIENAFYVAASRKVNERITIGAAVNYINSKLDIYQASGLSLNTGIHYFNPIKNLGIGFTIRNIAHQLTTYQSSKENTSPLVIEMGLSKRLKHLPLVYHISLKHLEQWDLRYDNPSDRQSNSVFENQKEASKFDKLLGNSFRHFGFGIELFLSKKENFIVRAGYNPLLSKDLALADFRSFTGICAGFGLKVYKFKIDYGYARYHLAGGTHHFGFSTDINSFLKKDL